MGTASIPAQTVASGSSASVAVVFPVDFTTVPVVVIGVSVGVSAFITAKALAVTTHGFTAYANNIYSASQTWGSAILLGWIAST